MPNTLRSSPQLTIADRAARLLATSRIAVSGQGGHDATYSAAQAVANGYALDEETALALLFAHYNPRCLPPWSVSELRHKVRDALANPDERGRGYLLDPHSRRSTFVLPAVRPEPQWLNPDPAFIAQIISSGFTASDLCGCSPIQYFEDDADELVERLFSTPTEPDPLLCVGRSNHQFATRPLSELISADDLTSAALIVPSPMCARVGRTKAGRVSQHTLQIGTLIS